MISKLPKWVWIGAWILAFTAGIINVVALLGFEHETVTHLTGNTTRLSEALARFDGSSALHFSLSIGSFVVGTALSGYLIRDTALQWNRNYGTVLLLEAALLMIAIPLFRNRNIMGLYAAACASGLQNAMVTTYSGAVVRTTHLSGMFTDLGISIGHFLRGIPIHSRRVWLCVVVISGFLIGGVVGALLFKYIDFSALYLPSGICIAVAASLALARNRESSIRRG